MPELDRPRSVGGLPRLPIKPISLQMDQLNEQEEDELLFSLDGPILSPLPIKSAVSVDYEYSPENTNEVDLSSSMKAKNEFMEIVLGNNLYKKSFKRKNSDGPKKHGLAF